MPPRKRTKFQRESHLEAVTEMYLCGKFQSEIAAALNISQGQVSYDVAIIQKRWRESSIVNWDEARGKELAELDLLRREYREDLDRYLAAWEASKLERSKTRKETDGTKDRDGNLITKKATVETEKRDGNPAFLDGMIKCKQELVRLHERRCKILGLDAPTKTQNLNVDLSTLTDEQLDRLEAGESLEQVLKRDRATT
jgi:hypothetical protein